MTPQTETTNSIPFELEALARGVNYQKWVIDTIYPYLGDRILEFGAGIGNMSQWLPQRELLYVTEADPHLFTGLQKKMKTPIQNAKLKVEHIDITAHWLDRLKPEQLDTIVSFNVLEHIEPDLDVLTSLCDLLRESKAPGRKRILSFVPAHQWLYGSIDKTFGHVRRYNVKRFKNFVSSQAPDFELETFHFNLFGLPGWYWMGKVLNKESFGLRTVDAFEKLCPFIRGIDDILHRRLHLPFGQSILAVMTLKNEN